MTEQEINPLIPQSVIIPRSEHSISRASISDNALKVLYRLKNAGYQAYLVGGGVRDLTLGREPKDFDIATDALPEDVKALFRNCRLIGRRFRLAHVHFGPEIIEVATFRALHDGEAGNDGDVRIEEDGRVLRDNVYGTVEEDALRRDFTINSLYYNIADFSIVDFANGMADLQEGVLRLIGDPEVRYREDAVRMLRAVRFAAKLGFIIDEQTASPIARMATLLEQIPQARLFEEVLKLFMTGHGLATFELLRRYGLFAQLFPETEEVLETDGHDTWVRFIARALENTDARISEGKPVTPAFLFAALLWPAITKRSAHYRESRALNEPQALQEAVSDVADAQLRRVALPKRFGIPMREIFLLQPRLGRPGGKRAQRLLSHPRFRAAYDFLLLRAAVGEVEQELADSWTRLQEGSEGQEALAVGAASDRPPPRRRRRRRRPAGGDGGAGGGQ
ncbi:MAG: polynucleotide adenylyltransferase PcnB [Aquisalimonadaceae bacterium]